MENKLKLSIVTVSWNVKEALINCLRSIEENRPCDEYEVIVIDNASKDGTVEAIRRDFPEVKLVINTENRGFAAANNEGIQESRGQYILFLNPDTIVHPCSLDILVKFMDDNADVGACGPKLLNADGTTQPSARRFPTFRGSLYCHTAFRFLGIFRGQYKNWLMKDFDYERSMDVDQLMGAALMVRSSVIGQVGRMDERFFIYYEEVDLCYRIKQAGWRIVFLPQAVIGHLGGQSTAQVPVKRRIIMLTSLLSFFRKHRGRLSTSMFSAVFKSALVLRDICNFVSGILTYIVATLRSDRRRKQNAATIIRQSAIWLGKYSWYILFKM
jgi:GT2 family glycosyltransferase